MKAVKRDGSINTTAALLTQGVLLDRLHAWIAAGSTFDPKGAYCGWRRADGSLSEPYPEITGYVLTYWSWAAEIGLASASSPDPRAKAAADWLATRFLSQKFAGRPRADGELVYFFDLAMGAHGLFNWAQLHGDGRHQAAGQAAVERILFSWRNRTFDELPAVDRFALRRAHAKWSLTGTAHLVKVAQALLMAELHGSKEAGALAHALVEGALAEIQDFGVPLSTSPSGPISLHALAYAAEGLWCWSERKADSRAREASARITQWLLSLMCHDGTMPGFVDKSDRTTQPQSDVLAQTLRLARLHGVVEQTCDMLEAAVNRSTRSVHHDRACLVYWPMQDHSDENTWATSFGAQALALGRDPGLVTWRSLV
ncbi:hypothetical protein [Brevibacterium casei]|uniref:hypothetical protein n=1 Tax=Brevibacterium casei TaxID=33889 RepID=UPI00223A7F54|nr:hypothetical protein [Brevibacterium casei]MCT1549637.1 hypothetical protein [Brevibacterium casei]MCT1559174.1 hypothetical protein [Brevibacterium casei]MCT2207602.1 hypothetical protein [Brevibacterium casei]